MNSLLGLQINIHEHKRWWLATLRFAGRCGFASVGYKFPFYNMSRDKKGFSSNPRALQLLEKEVTVSPLVISAVIRTVGWGDRNLDVHWVSPCHWITPAGREHFTNVKTPSPSPLGFPLSLWLSPLLSCLPLFFLSLSLSLCAPSNSYSIQAQRRERTLRSPWASVLATNGAVACKNEHCISFN